MCIRDRVLEDLRPHFGRVILAVDRTAPAVLGSVLAGRVMDGWWAGPGRSDGHAADRRAITLRPLDLSAMPQASLQAIEARLAGTGGASSARGSSRSRTTRAA